ncbi:MAG: hypothetical protein ACOYMR_17595 [Ilumatobacteraceae bacterium]
MRRILLVTLLLLAVPIALVVRPAAAAPKPEALLVGDSVMNGMAQPYGATSRFQLAARYSYILDTEGCRRLITTSCRIGDNPAPTNAITEVRANAGQYRTALVIGAGYNDPTTGEVGLDTAIDVMLAESARQGVPYLVWLTYRVAGPSASRFAAHNALLRARAAAEPRLIIADWATRSAAFPSSWFSADGIHLGTDATIAMADLIGDTLDSVAVAWGYSKCVVTATTVGLAPTTTVAPHRAVASARASRPAKRLNLWCP